jgi:hypothetical protein
MKQKATIKMNEMRIVLTSRAPDKLFSDLLPSTSRELTLHLHPISFVQLRCPWSTWTGLRTSWDEMMSLQPEMEQLL